MGKFVALLRGINVGGHARVPMAELRALAEGLGWKQVRTYIQSGNLVFEAGGKASALEAALEESLEKAFGFVPAVIVRSASEWTDLAAANPFPKESESEPNRVMIGLSKHRPKPGAAEEIEARASAGERVREAGGTVWFHYPEGAGNSKLTPSLIDRLVGSPLTARNWRTFLKLQEMLS
ncbi:MAG TPA: DUF1697 domain-containing protein [Allosphingosinicella sp.]|nr:DUF1697 domain-containing protein [Allosphingosinicella sp.]